MEPCARAGHTPDTRTVGAAAFRLVGRAFGALLAVAAASTGCTEGDFTERGNALAEGCGGGVLVLTPAVEIPFARPDLPEAVAASQSLALVVRRGGRTVSALRLPGGNVVNSWAFEGDVSAVAHEPGGFLIAAKTVVYRLSNDGTEMTELRGLVPMGEIRGVVAGEKTVWTTSRIADQHWLAAYAHGSGTNEVILTNRIAVPRQVRLHAAPNGTVLAAEVGSPYTITALDAGLRVRWSYEVGSSSLFQRARPASGELYSLGAIPLDCERVVQTFTDLQSERRLFVVFDARRQRALRVTELAEAVGLVHAIGHTNSLVGAVERPGGRSVLTFLWTWE